MSAATRRKARRRRRSTWSCATTSTAFTSLSDVIDRVPKLGYMAAYAKQAMRDKLIEHKQYITRHGDDMPEVKNWRWPAAAGGG